MPRCYGHNVALLGVGVKYFLGLHMYIVIFARAALKNLYVSLCIMYILFFENGSCMGVIMSEVLY